MTRPLALLVALALAGCAAQPPEPPDSAPASAAEGGSERLVGTVRVVGSAPMNVSVVLQPPGGGSVQLVGPLRDELRRLAGAEVAVDGPSEPSPDPLADRQLRVDRYEILSVDGEPVLSGTVEGRSGEWLLLRTTAGELVYLGGATSGLAEGQKVWVQGPRAVIVQSHGIVRP